MDNQYRATISYEGTAYFGWQKTQMGPSIQAMIEEALFRITGQSFLPEGASRTDRGVHAENQVISFTLQKELLPYQILKALNAHLPKDIRIKSVEKDRFHPSLDAKGKLYRYQICNIAVQDPVLRDFSWHIYEPLNLDLMKEGIHELLGTHDFSAFANKQEKNPICTLKSIRFDGTNFWIEGDRFLYKMVRNLVGSLVYLALNRLDSSLKEILLSKDRKRAGITAPAHGLYLHQVFYPVQCPESDRTL